jgi:hypothetical protein
MPNAGGSSWSTLVRGLRIAKIVLRERQHTICESGSRNADLLIEHGWWQVGPRPVGDAGWHIRAAIGDAGEGRQKIRVPREIICIARQKVRVRHRARRRRRRPRRSRPGLNIARLSWLKWRTRLWRLGLHRRGGSYGRDRRPRWRVRAHPGRNRRSRHRTGGGGCARSNLLNHHKSGHRQSGRYCHPIASHKDIRFLGSSCFASFDANVPSQSIHLLPSVRHAIQVENCLVCQ